MEKEYYSIFLNNVEIARFDLIDNDIAKETCFALLNNNYLQQDFFLAKTIIQNDKILNYEILK